MNGNVRGFPPGAIGVPDPRANAEEAAIVEAKAHLQAIQFSQQQRSEKANKAINFILLPIQGKDGVTRQDPEDTPESREARANAYRYLSKYFSTTNDFEDGLPVREESFVKMPGFVS